MKKMADSEKNLQLSKSHREGEENEELISKPSVSVIVLSSDDEEVNDNPSLKIVEKTMVRACTAGRKNDGVGVAVTSSVIDICSSPSQEAELVADVKSKKNCRKGKKRKNKKVDKLDKTVVVAMEEEKDGTNNALEMNELVEPNPIKIFDNTVLQKLLRGPRYFDPPDNGWGACYNCGEEGHTTVNCTSVKRKKPCFVCGSLGHHAKQCTKRQDCFICRKGSHRAKDCPEKYTRGSQNSKICLKCGDSGHDMFFCKNDYSLDDLKEIQCYICKSLGHLCCVDFTDNGPRELSCYRCGQLGHTGLECTRSRGETTSVGSLGSCFKCGERGHFARECTKSTKECTRSLVETTSVGSLGSCSKCGKEGHFERECTTATKECTRSLVETISVGSLGSCSKCGKEGHFERECTNSTKECTRSRVETTSVGSLGSCSKCGKEGHFERECTNSTKECTGSRVKTTSVGSLVLQECTKSCVETISVGSLRLCFKCGKEGHFEQECTNLIKECTRSGVETTSVGSLGSCFKCGKKGHFKRECTNSTKECTKSRVETTSVGSLGSCFKCGKKGHFKRNCIISTKECTRPRGETTSVGSLGSCFKCGEDGHFARECTISTKECIRSRGETTSVGSLGSCFKCGEEGHFRRECTNSTKVCKRNLESSTPTQKFSIENKDHVGVRAVPFDLGKVHKKKKGLYERGFTTPSNSKRMGGWIIEDPGDLPRGKAEVSGWGSPVTPTNKRMTYTSIASGHASSSHSSRKTQKLHFGTSASNGSADFYRQRYLVSRFGNSSCDGMWRNYDC